MKAAALPSNAIVTFESVKTMPPAALAISAAVTAYFAASVLTQPYRVKTPQTFSAPSVAVEPTAAIKNTRAPRVTHQPLNVVRRFQTKTSYGYEISPTIHGERARIDRQRSFYEEQIRKLDRHLSCVEAQAAQVPESKSVAPSHYGRTGAPPPLTQSRIFENLIPRLTSRWG